MDRETKELVDDYEKRVADENDPCLDDLSRFQLGNAVRIIREQDSTHKALEREFSAVITGVAKELIAVGHVDESGGDGIVLAVRHVLQKQRAEIESLRTDAEAWRKGVAILSELRARVIPCGHTVGDLIGGEGSVTKCGACLQPEAREQRRKLADRLRAAIRRQTVDVDDGATPNGPFERAIVAMQNATEPKRFYRNPDGARESVCRAMAMLCAAMADDTKELCEAASAYFGEDFNKLGAS